MVELAASGDTMEAMKKYRELTGAGAEQATQVPPGALALDPRHPRGRHNRRRWPRPRRTLTLLEREQELAELESALTDALDGEGRAVMVAGDPGIGKTSLLQAAVAAAGSRGFRVLTVRADALEVELSFGVCAHLFIRRGLADPPTAGSTRSPAPPRTPARSWEARRGFRRRSARTG